MQLKKLFSFIVSISGLLILGACAGNGTPDATPTVIVGSLAITNWSDVTNHTSCTGAAPTTATIYSTWHQALESNAGTADMAWTISSTSLVDTMTCTFTDGPTLTTSVILSVGVSGSQVQVLSTVQNSASQTVNGKPYTCAINVNPFTINYTLVGNCVDFTDGVNNVYMLPAAQAPAAKK